MHKLLTCLLIAAICATSVEAAIDFHGHATDGGEQVSFGVALGHPIFKHTQLMFEIYGATNSELGDNIVNFNIGADIELTASWHLLLAVGSGISEPTGFEELDYTGFLSVQYFTGV